MFEADVELRRRRDRAKVAQRNFRKRQADQASELKRKHEQLKHLVEEIVLASRKDDKATLNHAIAEAGKAIGLDVNECSQSESASCSQDHDASTTVVSNLNAHAPPEGFFDEESRGQSACYSRSGRFSPRLDYGIWIDPDRFIKILEPPQDIRPYVGPGKHTVAGHIAWACLDYGYARLQEAMMNFMGPRVLTAAKDIDNDALPGSLPPESAARRLFDLSLRHSKPLHDVAYIMALVEARMEFRNLGYMRSNSRGADEVSRQVMEGRVLDGLRTRGVKMDQWWSALDIEAHLQAKMGVLEFSALQIGLYNKEAAQTQVIAPLARSLAHRGVCFGDGPRWNVTHVTALVKAWVTYVSNVET